MKRLTFLTLLLFSFCISHGQDCMTFQEYEKDGKKVFDLDSIYQNGLEEHGGSWARFFDDYIQFLKDHGFEWGKPTWCVHRAYFNKKGSVELILYNFKKGEVPDEQQKEFNRLLKEFTKDYQLDIDNKAKNKFFLCGSMTYEDEKQ